MRQFIHFVVRKWIRGWEDIQNQEVRSRYGVLEGWVSIGVNFFLSIIKGLFGILTGSVALIADGFHTLSDVATSVVVVVSFKIARKPSDASHPFGHGRMEAVATVVVAVLLLVVGIEVFESALDRILHPKVFEASWFVIGVVVLTVVIKELLARFSRELGRMVESSTLEADFWHHRTDAISSILVILAFIGQRFGISYLDGAAGVVVAGMIVYAGWEVARKGVDDLLGTQPSDELVQKVKGAVRTFSEVLGVHDLIIHQYGHTNIMSFHIVVSDKLSLREGHALADRVGKTINKKFRTHTTVHLDPVNTQDPELKKIQEFLESFLDRWRGEVSFHDLRVVGGNGFKRLFMDLVVDPGMKDEEIEDLRCKIQEAVLKHFPLIRSVHFEVEPKYAR